MAQVTEPKKVVAMRRALEGVHVDLPSSRTSSKSCSARARTTAWSAGRRLVLGPLQDGSSPRPSQDAPTWSDDIKSVAMQVISHRIVMKPEAKIRGITGGHIVRKMLSEVPVPVVQPV